MSSPIFSNQYEITHISFRRMMDRWNGFKNDIDDHVLLTEIKYQLGRDAYNDAKLWLKLFKDAEWYRDDLI